MSVKGRGKKNKPFLRSAANLAPKLSQNLSNPSLSPKGDSLLSSLSPVSTPSTVVSHHVDDFQSEDLVHPLDMTAPGAKASAAGPYDEVQQLADKAKELNVDPTVWLYNN